MKDRSRVKGIGTFVKLTTIEGKDKELNRMLEGINTTGKTTGATCQTCKLVAQLGVDGFNRISLGLVVEGSLATDVDHRLIEIQAIAVVMGGIRSGMVSSMAWRVVAVRSPPHHTPQCPPLEGVMDSITLKLGMEAHGAVSYALKIGQAQFGYSDTMSHNRLIRFLYS